MKVVATSIDHHRADLSEREIFACSEEQAKKVYDMAMADPAISAAVLINTCNRTELYLSLEGAGPDPFDLLCRTLDIEPEDHRHLQRTIEDEEALRHLCLLTAGAESQLWGDSQIITQVGEAVDEAREMGFTDATLNTMFRLAITAGKEIRSRVDLHIHDASTADMAAERIAEETGVEKVLVIGNGAIGRMVAGRLTGAGLKTHMTLRKYNHGEVDIPDGVEPVPYADRYRIMEDCDAVVSATASPHLVITRKELEGVKATPGLFIDMAVPRDIEEGVGEMDGVQCYNIDDISRGHHSELKKDQLATLEEYIEDHVKEFRRWERSRTKVEDKINRFTDPERMPVVRKHFPLFINTEDRPAVVIGGGNIAERRVMTLAEFGFAITIVSEDLTETLERIVEGGAATWVRKRYDTGLPDQSGEQGKDDGERTKLMDEAWMILACTNDRDTNRSIGEYCRSKGKLVNVCDARNESTFWFPAVALNDELTVGLVGRGTDHMNVKKAASALRKVVENKQYK